MSVVSMLYNVQLLRYAGEDGVAAYGVLMYVSLIFQAVFIGYSVGTAPVIGYNYGAQNSRELKGMLRKTMVLMGTFAVIMFAAANALAAPLSYIFTGYDEGLFRLTSRAFFLFLLLLPLYSPGLRSVIEESTGEPARTLLSFISVLFRAYPMLGPPKRLLISSSGGTESIIRALSASVSASLYLKSALPSPPRSDENSHKRFRCESSRP